MDANLVLEILNNDMLSTEERDILLKKLAQESLEKEKMPNKRDELIEKSRRQAEENRLNLQQINYNSQLKYQMEVLSFLKNNMGVNQFSEEYLRSLRGSELNVIYEDCLKTMPEAMKKAKEERNKVFADNGKIFDDYNLNTKRDDDENSEDTIKQDNGPDTNDDFSDDKTLDDPIDGKTPEVPAGDRTPEKPEESKLDDIANRLGVEVDDLPEIAEYKKNKQKRKKPKRIDEGLTGQRIVKEEDGSKFTQKIKSFAKKHWKKALAAGGIVGGLVLTYWLLKNGMTPDNVPDPSITPDTIPDPSPVPDQTPVQPDSDFIDSLSRTDVGTIDKTYDENQFVINDINAETPNEYHQNEIINAVTEDDRILPADTIGDIADYKANGENITSIQVGDANGIDGHVPVDQVIDENYMEKYQEYKSGGVIK